MGLVLSFGGHFEVSVSFMSSKDWILCPHFSLVLFLEEPLFSCYYFALRGCVNP